MLPPYKNARSPKISQSVLSSLSAREPRLTARAMQKETLEATAWHEAGHAVVGARLGMKLYKVEIPVRFMTYSCGEVRISTGYTTYVVNGLADQFGTEGANRARAVFAAAGIAAELARGNRSTMEIQDDSDGIRRYARALGIEDHPSNRELAVFFADAVNEATGLLLQDGGKAWVRVRTALKQRLELSHEKVLELMS